MSRFWAVRVGISAVALLVVEGCVSDHALEDDVEPSVGVIQPEGGSSEPVAASAACERIESARSGAAAKLGCDTPEDSCPALLLLAGSIPCDDFTGGSIAACEAAIGAYRKCSDFDTKPCVVTPVSTSCHAPAAPDAAAHPSRDGGTKPKDGGTKPRDAGVTSG